MTAATSTSDWIVAEGWREGLFAKCVSDFAPLPLPFDIPAEPGCSKARAVSKWSKIISRPKSKLFFSSQATSVAPPPLLSLVFCLISSALFWQVLVWEALTPTKSTNTTVSPSMHLSLHVSRQKLIHPYRRKIFHPNQWKNISTINTFSVAALLLAAIILPVQFSKDLANGKSES